MNPASPPGSLAYTGILSECRDLLLKHLSEDLNTALDSMDKDLQQKRSAAGMGDAMVYATAQDCLKAAAPGLERSWRRAFERSFRERVARRGGDNRRYDGLKLNEKELSLLDEASFAESLAVQQMLKRLTAAAANELKELQPRVSILMGLEEMEPEKDPLGPDSVCDALKEVCWDMGSTPEVRTALLEQMIATLAKAVADAYDELNAHLDNRNVPGPPRGIRRERGPSRPATETTDSDKNAGNEASGQGKGGTGSGSGNGGGADGDEAEAGDGSGADRVPAPPREVQQYARSLFSGQTFNPPAEMLQRPEGAPPPISNTEAMQVLTQLQRGEQASINGESGVIASFTAPADPTTNVLHGLKKEGFGQHLQPMDSLVIDVVATLFDHIFDDRRVPEAVKGLIGRLQIPLLKLAMMDRAFLSNNKHPARLFINKLAEAAASQGSNFTTDCELYKKAEEQVFKVLHEFAEDTSVFDACITELDAYLAEETRKADEEAAAQTAELERQEREELSRNRAQEAVATLITDKTLPNAVRQFIEGPWQQVLTKAAVDGDEQDAPWYAALSTMDMLIWSVRPKYGSDGRQQLIKELPGLLKGLRTNLEKVETPADQRETFFTELVELHTTAVKKGVPQPGTVVEPPPKPRKAPEADSPDDGTTGTAEGQTGEGGSGRRRRGHGVVVDSSPLDHIARGAWLNLRQDDGSTRSMRLGWISPAKTIYLFTNEKGQNATVMSRAELEDRFAFGTVFAVDEDHSFIDRVVDTILAKYDPQAA